jgi:hypothetical protein
LAEIEAKLQLAPMVAGGKAARRLVEEAKKHRNMSENALKENSLGAAAGLLHAAEELLERAEMSGRKSTRANGGPMKMHAPKSKRS